MADGALMVFWLGWWVCEVRDGMDRGVGVGFKGFGWYQLVFGAAARSKMESFAGTIMESVGIGLKGSEVVYRRES